MANRILISQSKIDNDGEHLYMYPSSSILMSDNVSNVEEAINNKPGKKIEGGGELFNNAGNASGNNSHAEGYGSSATGNAAHAEGTGTIATADCQHVQGKYNIEDTEGVYAHIVGWGTSDSSRANIHTINTIGDGWFAGTVKGESGLGFSDFSMEQINSATSGADQTYSAVLKHSGNSVSSIDHAGNGWFAGAVEADKGIKLGGATLKYDEELQTVVFQFNE